MNQSSFYREYEYSIYIQDGWLSLRDDDCEIEQAATSLTSEREFILAGNGSIAIRAPQFHKLRVLVDVRRSNAGAQDECGLSLLGECALDVPSGRIVISGSENDYLDAARIPVEPALYKMRVLAGSLDSMFSGARLSQNHYRLVLWQL
jgi:hypothetical protein